MEVVGSLLLDAQQSFLINHFCHRGKVLEWNYCIRILWLVVFHRKVSHPTGTILHELDPRWTIQSHQMIRRLHRRQHNCTNVAALKFNISPILGKGSIFQCLLPVLIYFIRSEIHQTELKHFHSIPKRNWIRALVDLVLVKLTIYHLLDAISEPDLQLILRHQLLGLLSLRNSLSSLKIIWHLAVIASERLIVIFRCWSLLLRL